MPRDASVTRERLLVAAEELFATHGIYQAATRDITAAAGQRNTSALTYHFGSRSGVLAALLAHHGDPIDTLRGESLCEPIDNMPTRALIGALLVPYASALTTARGRNYLRIVVQLSGQFPGWRNEHELNPPHLRRILGQLEARVDATPAIAGERIVNMVMLMTAAFAERARLLAEDQPLALAADEFVANLADQMVAGLEAATGPPFPVLGG